MTARLAEKKLRVSTNISKAESVHKLISVYDDNVLARVTTVTLIYSSSCHWGRVVSRHCSDGDGQGREYGSVWVIQKVSRGSGKVAWVLLHLSSPWPFQARWWLPPPTQSSFLCPNLLLWHSMEVPQLPVILKGHGREYAWNERKVQDVTREVGGRKIQKGQA